MATSPVGTPLNPQVQQWIHRVIQPEYHDTHLTYHNVAATLYQFPTLSPRTDVYTHEDGRSQLLLNLVGTFPVTFRGATYQIPLKIWLLHEYPKQPPMVFVNPTRDMLIRPGNHVDPSGRCYHPYLANWVNYSDRSTIVDLLEVLRQVFGREPPVYARQQQNTPGPQTRNETPPPLPPLPPGLGRTNSPATPPNHAQAAVPPPLPPLPRELSGGTPSVQQQQQVSHAGYQNQHQQSPPPIPPHPQPQQLYVHPQPQQQHQQQGWPRNESPRGGSLPSYQDQGPPPPPLPPAPHRSEESSPVPQQQQPLQYNRAHAPTPYHHPQTYHQIAPPPNSPGSGPALSARSTPPPHQNVTPSSRFPSIPSVRPVSFNGFPHSPHPQSYSMPQQQQQQQQQQPQPHIPPKRPEAIDIMSLPPTEIAPLVPSAAPPPLPPNPEKDRLIQEITKALQARAEAHHAKMHVSLEQAAAQCEAILRAESNMERERAELARIMELCDKDADILKERITMAGEVIKDAESRELPGVDTVVVAPTVVHTQLYDLVTEDMAIEDTIYVLGKALDKERISLDVFLKHTRTLAREQFNLRALVKKITRQIGIES
ncbi:uncharacterized protein H6S33_009304 [Morchella sextelata]|uniref:uncharacterized protein n=1 Tax=Morchella sextelata TaxID=1174677 RepID=UPI001D04AF6F|nr:uncharacterized protein H6S33_009304 [Morchella sextelata]KAH0612924.1 hypothetical protein H6S33_009304 [Morchella sextelata]